MQATSGVNTLWKIDKDHSEIHFKVKHIMVSTVTGAFNDFEGTIESESDDFEDAKVSFSALTASVDTRNEQRDEHLRSDDFFNAGKFPQLTFDSKSFSKAGDGKYLLIGDLTIRDHTEEVKLDVEYNGSAVDAYGQTKAGFEISGKIKRKTYGLLWNGLTEVGGVIVSDEVRLDLNVQLIRQ